MGKLCSYQFLTLKENIQDESIPDNDVPMYDSEIIQEDKDFNVSNKQIKNIFIGSASCKVAPLHSNDFIHIIMVLCCIVCSTKQK